MARANLGSDAVRGGALRAMKNLEEPTCRRRSFTRRRAGRRCRLISCRDPSGGRRSIGVQRLRVGLHPVRAAGLVSRRALGPGADVRPRTGLLGGE